MLRLRELTAQVSIRLRLARVEIEHRARAFGQLGNDRKADDTRTGSPCGVSALMISRSGK